jgi:hypothetical protein
MELLEGQTLRERIAGKAINPAQWTIFDEAVLHILQSPASGVATVSPSL